MKSAPRIAVALSLLLAAVWSASASAQTTKAGVVTALEGNVTAARTSGTQPVALKFKDDVFVGTIASSPAIAPLHVSCWAARRSSPCASAQL